jgi:hypothetical protein
MLRLKSPGFERLFQSPALEATFGGAEANVAVSLAQFGVPVSFVSAIPANQVGDACIGELRRFGVDTSHVRRGGERLGIYFLEAGANQRGVEGDVRPVGVRDCVGANPVTSTGTLCSPARTGSISRA